MAGGRILVVDDDTSLRTSVARVLEDEGYSVDHAGDGAAALDKISRDPPDVIVLDVMMPGMNGQQLLKAIRQDVELADIPVVVMTALHGLDAKRALDLGANDLVEKPFDVDQLLNKVALALFRAREYPTIPDRPMVVPEMVPELESRRHGTTPPQLEPEQLGVVMVVDDDLDLAGRIDGLLSAEGYTVVSLQRVPPDLERLARVLEPKAIFIDLRTVNPDGQHAGLAALRRLRADRSLDPVPILVLSRTPQDLDRVRGEIEELSAAAILKPVASERILDLLGAPPPRARRSARL